VPELAVQLAEDDEDTSTHTLVVPFEKPLELPVTVIW
jgi:hypothetical protein